MCNEHINFHIADAYNIISILVSKLCQLFFPPSITNNNKVYQIRLYFSSYYIMTSFIKCWIFSFKNIFISPSTIFFYNKKQVAQSRTNSFKYSIKSEKKIRRVSQWLNYITLDPYMNSYQIFSSASCVMNISIFILLMHII